MESQVTPLGQADRLTVAAVRLTKTLQQLTSGGPLSSTQVGALIPIVYAKRIVARDLATYRQVTPATVSKLLNELEAKGLIIRRPDESDARLQWIEATAQGARLVAEQHDRRLAPLSAAVADLSKESRAKLEEAIALIEDLTAAAINKG